MDLKCCVIQGSSAPFQISLLPCSYFGYLVFSLQRRSFCFVFSFLSQWWFSILKAVLLCQITLLYFQVSQKKESTQKTQNRGSEVPWGCHGYWNCLGGCESKRGAEKGPGSGGRGEEQRDGGRRWGQSSRTPLWITCLLLFIAVEISAEFSPVLNLCSLKYVIIHSSNWFFPLFKDSIQIAFLAGLENSIGPNYYRIVKIYIMWGIF